MVLVALFVAGMSLTFRVNSSGPTSVAGHQGKPVSVPGNLDVTLLRHSFSTGTSRVRPPAGFLFLVTDWKLHNPGKAPRPVLRFQAVSGLHIEDARTVPGERFPLTTEPIPGGDNAVGTLVFDVEAHAHAAGVTYRSGNLQVTWQFRH